MEDLEPILRAERLVSTFVVSCSIGRSQDKTDGMTFIREFGNYNLSATINNILFLNNGEVILICFIFL
jgi:hypothetical protein